MKLLKSFKILMSAFLITTTFSCNLNDFNYNIKEYTLTLEPRVNSSDVDATIDITYTINGPDEKSDGFKFVGNGTVDSLICSDETGIIRGRVEYLRDTKISWYFNPLKSGIKKIKARFILRDFLISKENTNKELNIPWAGVFRVDVEHARYVITMHHPNTVLIFMKPENWKHEIIHGENYYSYNQSPLKDRTVKIQLEN